MVECRAYPSLAGAASNHRQRYENVSVWPRDPISFNVDVWPSATELNIQHRYMRWMAIGIPGLSLTESMKAFLQVQGKLTDLPRMPFF